MLTEKGEKFFEEHANFEDKLQKKMAPMGPMFFLMLGLNADGLHELQEPARRFFAAILNLRSALRENLTEQTLKEVEEFLNGASEKIEKLNEKIMRR
jgi:flavodoxin